MRARVATGTEKLAMARARPKHNAGNGRSAAEKREARMIADDENGGYGRWYDPARLPDVIEAGKRGDSETQIAAWIFNVPRSVLRSMARKRPELQRALDIASAHAEAWWEHEVKISRKTPHFNAHAVKHMMSSRFRATYSDRLTLEGSSDAPLVHKIERVIVKAKRDRHADN